MAMGVTEKLAAHAFNVRYPQEKGDFTATASVVPSAPWSPPRVSSV